MVVTNEDAGGISAGSNIGVAKWEDIPCFPLIVGLATGKLQADAIAARLKEQQEEERAAAASDAKVAPINGADHGADPEAPPAKAVELDAPVPATVTVQPAPEEGGKGEAVPPIA